MIRKLFSFLRNDSVDEGVRVAEQLRNDGYAHLKGVLTGAECDAICASFDDYVAANREEADRFVMDTARHSRLTNMHLVSAPARDAITKPRVVRALDAFFEAPAFVATSLFFEQSSEQDTHRDTPFFHTRPRNLFAGIWFALEDVHPDSGPLHYYPGGHHLDLRPGTASTSEEILPTYYEFMGRLSAELAEKRIPKKIALIRKGDCFIWHPELPHGGTPIRQPGMTRKSMVFHCAPQGETMYGWDEFFGVTPISPKPMPLIPMSGDRMMVPHERPMFAANN